MPVAFLTCGRPAQQPAQAGRFPQWEKGEWWDVETAVALDSPSEGAPLSGRTLRHRFMVVGEEAVDDEDCWRVEVKPVGLPRACRELRQGKPVAVLLVSKAVFRAVHIRAEAGAGDFLLDEPVPLIENGIVADGPWMHSPPLPTLLDMPVGPRIGPGPVPQDWRSGVFEGPFGTIRQSVSEVAEGQGSRRKRVLRVVMDDGDGSCLQTWRQGRPWPDSQRAWRKAPPAPPFAYQTEVVAWSREPYRGGWAVFFLVFGFAAQGLFTMRFIVQWIASEKARRSVIPMAFWYCSLAGGVMLLIYAIYRLDPVFILGQSTGSIIYARNVVLRLRERQQLEAV